MTPTSPSRISRLGAATAAAVLGAAVGALTPLVLFGCLWFVGLLGMVFGRHEFTSLLPVTPYQYFFCVMVSAAAAIALREAWLWFAKGQDNDKIKFFKRAATTALVGLPVAGTIIAVMTAQDYRVAGLTYCTIFPCALAGALACGLFQLVRPQAPIASGFRRGAGRAACAGGLAVVMLACFLVLFPPGLTIASAVVLNEPFVDELPESYWQERTTEKYTDDVRKNARRKLEELADKRRRKNELIEPLPPRSSSPDKPIAAALALPDAERRAAALLKLIRDSDSKIRSQTMRELIHDSSDSTIRSEAVRELARERQVNALIDVLKNDDLFTRNRAVEELARLGPDARPAVPALLDLWWDSDRTFGNSLEEYADAIDIIEPGALARSRIEHYALRCGIAGLVLAIPVFALLRLRFPAAPSTRGKDEPADSFNPFAE